MADRPHNTAQYWHDLGTTLCDMPVSRAEKTARARTYEGFSVSCRLLVMEVAGAAPVSLSDDDQVSCPHGVVAWATQ